MDFINLKGQYQAYREEIDREIRDVLSSQRFILGEKGKRLEEELAAFVGSRYAISVASGTDALILSLRTLGVSPGDEIITTPFTFIATAESAVLAGATPVFCDVEEDTFLIDPEKIEERITDRTRGIIVVDLFGCPADYERVRAIAKKHDLFILQDGAQSFGAMRGGRKSPSMGDMGITSFFPAKPLGCFGDGGMIFTDCESHARMAEALRNHGQTSRYVHTYMGQNSRLDEIQAAVLLVKGRHFEEEITTRQEKASFYSKNLPEGIICQRVPEGVVPTYAQYSILVNDREGFSNFLSKRNIPTAVHYPVPIHLQKSFGYLGYGPGEFPVSEQISNRIVSLPFSPFMSVEDQERVISALHSYRGKD